MNAFQDIEVGQEFRFHDARECFHGVITNVFYDDFGCPASIVVQTDSDWVAVDLNRCAPAKAH